MSVFNFMRRGKGMKKPPLLPIHTVRPPSEARAKRQASLAKDIEESGIFELEKKHEDEFMDTGSLELQGATGEIENPYETHSWEMDPDEGLRRVEDQSMVNRKKPKGDADNPYDTIIKKKGW